MDYEFTATAAHTHLHVIGSGVHSIENIRRLFADTHREILRQHFDAVLIEARFEGPSLDFASIYSIITDTREHAMLVRRIAYVDTNTEHLSDRTEFAELAANRLGVNARVFPNVIEAQAWLSG